MRIFFSRTRWTHRRSHKYGYPRRALNEYWIIALYKTLGEASTVSQVDVLLLDLVRSRAVVDVVVVDVVVVVFDNVVSIVSLLHEKQMLKEKTRKEQQQHQVLYERLSRAQLAFSRDRACSKALGTSAVYKCNASVKFI